MNTSLPDVASQIHSSLYLDQVGMAGIPLRLVFDDQPVQARATLTVDLDSQQRGIHMSRLYLGLEEALGQASLSPAGLFATAEQLLATQGAGSQQISLTLEWEQLRLVPALLSPHQGWQAYPMRLTVQHQAGQTALIEQVSLLYSSTCPCSAALSREALAEALADDFATQPFVRRETLVSWLREHGSLATPHSQRSQARLSWKRAAQDVQAFHLMEKIQAAEQTLATAVQTAVKRTDEQAFALRNGANQMFCEDAARRLTQMMEQDSHWLEAHIQVAHFESLHAHDAIASRWLSRTGTPQPWFLPL
ncbi:GTP cyclohydrolase FolE2 [Marinospirillum sp.]|uniref:GTP cyclohydrolase FolE2 n=1 Tax=Marinospirillum sp. TaxID=2183934 RepID=UPI003A89B4DE